MESSEAWMRIEMDHLARAARWRRRIGWGEVLLGALWCSWGPIACEEGPVSDGSGSGGAEQGCGPVEGKPVVELGTWGREETTAMGGGAGSAGSSGLEESETHLEAPDTFFALESHQDVWLQFAGQVGMGLGMVLRLDNLTEEDLERIRVRLLLDEEPLGSEIHEFPAPSCQAESLYLDAMVMIDVGAHPAITSVAQLDRAPATVEYEVTLSEDRVLVGSEDVTLNL